jgi:hypothetical protein
MQAVLVFSLFFFFFIIEPNLYPSTRREPSLTLHTHICLPAAYTYARYIGTAFYCITNIPLYRISSQVRPSLKTTTVECDSKDVAHRELLSRSFYPSSAYAYVCMGPTPPTSFHRAPPPPPPPPPQAPAHGAAKQRASTTKRYSHKRRT